MAGDFKKLFKHELEVVAKDATYDVATDKSEPFVNYVSADLVGLALSGGGIRSATFSLGLLQGLWQLGILQFFS